MATESSMTKIDERQEIDALLNRFLDEAPRRGFSPRDRRRAGERLYHGHWPILVSFLSGDRSYELGAALYNISSRGLAFTTFESIDVGSRVWVKLVRADQDRPRIPCVVRHQSEHSDGYMVGCEILEQTSHDQA